MGTPLLRDVHLSFLPPSGRNLAWKVSASQTLVIYKLCLERKLAGSLLSPSFR